MWFLISVCKPGYEERDGNATCQACPENTYKHILANDRCLTCVSFDPNSINPNTAATSSDACGMSLSSACFEYI